MGILEAIGLSIIHGFDSEIFVLLQWFLCCSLTNLHIPSFFLNGVVVYLLSVNAPQNREVHTFRLLICVISTVSSPNFPTMFQFKRRIFRAIWSYYQLGKFLQGFKEGKKSN